MTQTAINNAKAFAKVLAIYQEADERTQEANNTVQYEVANCDRVNAMSAMLSLCKALATQLEVSIEMESGLGYEEDFEKVMEIIKKVNA